MVFSHQPREPRWAIKLLARLQGGIQSNFYFWSRTAAGYDFERDIPDLFYGRAWPHASLVPAHELAQKYRRPLWLHFSDPFPPPNETVSSDTRFLADLQHMVDAAAGLTFTNSQTIAYQRRFISFAAEKAGVLNHIAPAPMTFATAGESGHFYHVGKVGPSRSPAPLLDGFALHVKQYPESRLFFVGAPARYVEPEIAARGLSAVVQVLPFTQDIRSLFQRAGVLVSIDAWIEEPMFTPTKIVDYLVADRPILSITPPGSPVASLLARTPATALAITDYSAQAVAKGLEQAMQLQWQADADRLQLRADFRADRVAQQFEQLLTGQ